MQLDVEESTPASDMTFIPELQLAVAIRQLLKSGLVTFCPVLILVESEFWSSHRRTDRQTDSDAYEPTVHTHRCAQKLE